MKSRNVVIGVAASIVALSFLTVGCDRQVSKTMSTKERSDGSVKTEEKIVTQSPDGTVTKTEETKTTEPDNRQE